MAASRSVAVSSTPRSSSAAASSSRRGRVEESDRLAEIRVASLEQTADMSRVAAIDAMPGLSSARRRLLESASCASSSSRVASAMRASSTSSAMSSGNRGRIGRPSGSVGAREPSSRCFGVAIGQREEREQPACVAPHRRRALLEHDLRDVAEPASLAGVACVDRESPERDDAGGVEHCSRVGSVLEGEAAFEHRQRLGESSGPQEHAAVPGLEHLVGPALPVALGGGEAVGGDRERLFVAVGDAQQLAVPHVREP